jgi:hypothetical protein
MAYDRMRVFNVAQKNTGAKLPLNAHSPWRPEIERNGVSTAGESQPNTGTPWQQNTSTIARRNASLFVAAPALCITL